MSSDLPHIALTGVIVLFILSAIVFGASLYGSRWRLYSFATLSTLLISGAWTGFEATRLAAQQPTPWLGVAERINIGAYLLWVLVLGISLLRSKTHRSTPMDLEAIRGGASPSQAPEFSPPPVWASGRPPRSGPAGAFILTVRLWPRIGLLCLVVCGALSMRFLSCPV